MNGPIPGPAVILLGRQDYPVDGVRDYCARLQVAMKKHGAPLDSAEVRWEDRGWRPAFRALGTVMPEWAGRAVLVQYTHLMWPWRGFPFGFLQLLSAFRRRGARVIVVFHDPSPFPGSRLRDRVRRWAQVFVMRQAVRWADGAVSTIPPERIPWMRDPAITSKVAFIPVGSAVPEAPLSRAPDSAPGRTRRVAVFGVTGGPDIPRAATLREIGDIAHAVTRAATQVSSLELEVFGRGSAEAASLFSDALERTGVRLSVRGLLPLEEISRLLSMADALLCVRGHLSTRRTTGIAGIACGLPVIGYEGGETGYPMTEAGAVLVPDGDREALARALARVLVEEDLWRTLHQRNLSAHERFFSWDAIARCYMRVLSRA